MCQPFLLELEMNLVDLRQTGQGQDAVRFEAKLLSKLSYLTRGLAYADFPIDSGYSYRSATSGSTRLARWAGTRVASNATVTSTVVTPRNVAGSAGLMP